MTAPVSFPALSAVSHFSSPAIMPGRDASAADESTFGSLFAQFVNTMKQGESSAISGMTGEMPIQQSVEDVLAAERSLSAAIAVRDKIVNAYLELSRMQI